MERFDYIIVGGGTAGCPLAARLSENPRRRVLLLEAGPDDRRFWIRVPIGYGRTFFDPRVNWMYRTEPDDQLGRGPDYWPRGKVLGGSSSINAMVYIRGQAGDFDHWRDLGNPGWGWDDVLPVFRRMEDYEGGDDVVHGRGGPVHVSDVSDRLHPLCADFLSAGRELGVAYNPDFNGASQEGFGHYPITTRDGFRESAASAYLRRAMARPNLKVVTGALARRVLFDGRRATGVEYGRRGEVHRAAATAEVILCAGAINSPQLLQLSGVGPAALLGEHGIGLVHDLPAVGRNLQDHLDLTTFYRSRRPTLNNQLYPWWGKLWAGLRYVLTRTGPLALSVNHAGGFVRAHPEADRPDIQIYFSPLSYRTAPVGERPLMNPDPYAAFQLSFTVLRPTSRGHLQIRAADPGTAPAIHPNSVSTEADRQIAIAGQRFLRKLAAAPSMAALIEKRIEPEADDDGSDAALLDDFIRRASTVFHPTSTCAMGPDAGTSVVDSRLRVHGMEGLRVADASIFPAVTSGNTMAPSIMVGEKAADLIREGQT